MRTTLAVMTLLAASITAACGSDESLPAMPEPITPADETSGGDLDSLDAEGEDAEAADEE